MTPEIIKAGGALEAALREAAQRIFAVLKAQPSGAPLTVGLCGGRSVVGLLSALEQESHKQPQDLLTRVQFFMVDERLVPLTDDQSNYGGLKKLLFDKLTAEKTISESQLHPFVPDSSAPDFGCAAYGAELGRFGGRFTVVVLGVGEDGHVAGLFPRHPVLERLEPAFFSFMDSPKPPPARMTAGKALITGASLSMVLLLGEGKRDAWTVFRAGAASPSECPALLAREARGCIVVTDLLRRERAGERAGGIAARVALAVINLLLAGSLLIWPLLLLPSMMMFDAPHSTEDGFAVALFALIWLYPASVVIGGVGFLVSLARGLRLRTLVVWTCISLVDPMLVVLLVVLGFLTERLY